MIYAAESACKHKDKVQLTILRILGLGFRGTSSYHIRGCDRSYPPVCLCEESGSPNVWPMVMGQPCTGQGQSPKERLMVSENLTFFISIFYQKEKTIFLARDSDFSPRLRFLPLNGRLSL